MPLSDGAIKIWRLMIEQPDYDIWAGSDENAVHHLLAELHESGLIEYYNGIQLKTIGYDPKG